MSVGMGGETAALKPKILVVDDERNVVDALARILRRTYDVHTAISGEEGLALVEKHEFWAITSDMRMPQMDGATFLAKARAAAPNTVRILLTGQSDMEDAIAAINNGSVFRFLRKPCDASTLQAALSAACEQYRLTQSEKILLEETLRGAIRALCDTLALASPISFGMATQVKNVAARIAQHLNVADGWKVEVAAMLAQLGAVTVPAAVFERHARGEHLSIEERSMLDRVPEVTDRLLASIPRIDDIRAFVRLSQPRRVEEPGSPLESRILRAAADFVDHERSTQSAEKALAVLQMRRAHYDPKVLDALAQTQSRTERMIEVPITQLREGMTVAVDVRTKSGILLVARGHAVTAALLGRLENFVGALERTTMCVMARDSS